MTRRLFSGSGTAVTVEYTYSTVTDPQSDPLYPSLPAHLRKRGTLAQGSFAAFLFGEFSAADCAAFPFLKYALLHDPDDDELFHRILVDNLPLGVGHPRVAAWIRRMDARPRVPA